MRWRQYSAHASRYAVRQRRSRHHPPGGVGGTTPATGGNVNGIGLVDVTIQRLFDKLSFAETYPNALTSTATTAVKIPMVMANDRLAIQAAIRTSTIADPAAVRLAWIRDTLALDQLHVSTNLAAEVDACPNAQVSGPAQPLLSSPPQAACNCNRRYWPELLATSRSSPRPHRTKGRPATRFSKPFMEVMAP